MKTRREVPHRTGSTQAFRTTSSDVVRTHSLGRLNATGSTIGNEQGRQPSQIVGSLSRQRLGCSYVADTTTID
jgi:hypothetical protein